MRRWTPLLGLALIAAACSPPPADSTTTADATPSTTTTLAVASDDPCRSGDLEFGSDGLVAAIGESTSDATSISQIRWDPYPTCERLTISFTTDIGAPATTLGVTGVTAFGYLGITRVTLPAEVTGSAVADMRSDGDLLDRAYVIADTEGNLFIDLHAAEDAALATRAFVTQSPASLVIDLIREAEAPGPVGATVSDSAVIITPPPGPTIYPFVVEAYAPPTARATRIQLGLDGDAALDQTLSLEGRTDTWQFVTQRIVDGPSGTTRLFVGFVDVNNRPLDGAAVELDLP